MVVRTIRNGTLKGLLVAQSLIAVAASIYRTRSRVWVKVPGLQRAAVTQLVREGLCLELGHVRARCRHRVRSGTFPRDLQVSISSVLHFQAVQQLRVRGLLRLLSERRAIYMVFFCVLDVRVGVISARDFHRRNWGVQSPPLSRSRCTPADIDNEHRGRIDRRLIVNQHMN